MSKSIVVTGENFESEVIQSSIPVLVDFWAAWCGPCRMIGPVIDQFAEEYTDRLKVCKVNVDEEDELSRRHTIRSIPTLVVYKDGKIANQAAGALPKNDIEALFIGLI
ncbi:MAG: thioredoxin [Treponema sp.]|nr:thioredoxin [Treponema sp.]